MNKGRRREEVKGLVSYGKHVSFHPKVGSQCRAFDGEEWHNMYIFYMDYIAVAFKTNHGVGERRLIRKLE